MLLPLAAESAGAAAMVTAAGGVLVSLATVYLNSKKQATATNANSDQIEALVDQITDLQVRLATCEKKAKAKAKTTKKKV